MTQHEIKKQFMPRALGLLNVVPMTFTDLDMKEPNINVANLLAQLKEKDQKTYEHSLRVAFYTAQIAIDLGASEKQAQLLQKAAALHDMGKLQWSDEVLKGSGGISEIDRISHAANGSDLIAAAGQEGQFEHVAELMALLHHETMSDGREGKIGYFGVPPEQQPDYIKLIHITDIFDVLAERRAYDNRPKMSVREATNAMEDENVLVHDASFDAALLDVLVSKAETLHVQAKDIKRLEAMVGVLDVN